MNPKGPTSESERSVNSKRSIRELEGLHQIHGRLDFLVEAALEEARTSPRSRRAIETAMRKVRARAKANDLRDPIADLWSSEASPSTVATSASSRVSTVILASMVCRRMRVTSVSRSCTSSATRVVGPGRAKASN